MAYPKRKFALVEPAIETPPAPEKLPPADGEQFVLCAHVELKTPTPGQRAKKQAARRKKEKERECPTCMSMLLPLGRKKYQCTGEECGAIWTEEKLAESAAWLAEACGANVELCIAIAAFAQPGGARRLDALLKSGKLRPSDVHDPFLWEVLDACIFLLPSLVGDEPPPVELLMKRLQSRHMLPLYGANWFEWRLPWKPDGFSIEERAAQLRKWRRKSK